MKIAVTADPELPVPPKYYGGIERIIDLIVKGLIKRGHDVTLFAHRESQTPARLVSWPGNSSRSSLDTIINSTTLAAYVLRENFDILHSFSRLAYLLPVLPSRLPKIMSYQREISRNTTRLAHSLSCGSLEFSAISKWMMKGVEDIGIWHLIPNGVDLETFRFIPENQPEAPFVFLGRVEEIKGPHLAIDIARRVGRRLIIAGNIPNDKQAWAEENILKHVDGDRVIYVGPVDDTLKNLLLGSAHALLMPILWEEPFGIVMAEALACGTPVLGLNRGAVPEVVINGVTGFVSDNCEGLVAAAKNLDKISRVDCRADAESRFSADPIVDSYEAIYYQAIKRAGRYTL